MIIGISGKLGSGKDTVGLIIQALSEDNLTDGEVYEIKLYLKII
jgi:dephospho-CoA kinase